MLKGGCPIGTAGVNNEWYQAPLNGIRTRISHLFGGYFEYKGQFLEPVDWRPREHNTAADHLANYSLRHGADVGQLDLEVVRACFEISKGLQIFTDGGFEGEAAVGAAGITIF